MSKCLVVPRKNLEALPSWQKLKANHGGVLHALIPLTGEEVDAFLNTVISHGIFRERFGEGGVESDPNFQQVIFYGTIVRGSDEFFVYKRGTQDASDRRLASKLSVGVGGHIEPSDSNLIDSLYRELDEELLFVRRGMPIHFQESKKEQNKLNLDLFRKIASLEIKGLIKNDSDDVGKVHVGLFCVIRLLSKSIGIEIKDKKENVSGSFVKRSEYEQHAGSTGNPEVWTQLVVGSDLFPCK